MEETEKPNFYAILPADIRYDDRLSAREKLLYAEITALSNKEGYCWAGNTYFANLYNSTNRTIITAINNLENFGYLRREMIYKKNSKEVQKRLLYPVTKFSLPSEENFTTPREENFTDNNTSINNKKEYIIDLSKYKVDNESKFKELIQEWLDYKRERKESYKSQASLNIFIKRLVNLTCGKCEVAKERLEFCIANNYQGCLFPFNNNKNTIKKKEPVNYVDNYNDWSEGKEIFEEYYREHGKNYDY